MQLSKSDLLLYLQSFLISDQMTKLRAAITGVAGYVPETLLTNDDLSKIVDTNDEWITSRTGIKQRHILKEKGKATSDLGAACVKKLLDKTGTRPEEVDLLICGTVTADMVFPDTANTILDKVGAKNAFGYDINAACSGFVYSLVTASKFIETGTYKKVIVVGADMMSSIIDYDDRTTGVIFGDGAGAVVLSNTESRGILSTYLDCVIDKDNSLACNNKIESTPFFKADSERNTKVVMSGKSVMRFATKAFTEAVNAVVEKAGISVEDIKLIIPHQANLRILKAAANKMNIDEKNIYVNIDKASNTQAATIPIALHEILSKNMIRRGDIVLFVAFGAGLSAGAVLLEW